MSNEVQLSRIEKEDKTLWLDYLSGDNQALSILYKRHYLRIFNYCLARLKNIKDSEDLAQSIFEDLIQKRDSLPKDITHSFLAYILGAANNKCLNKVRNDMNRLKILQSEIIPLKEKSIGPC